MREYVFHVFIKMVNEQRRNNLKKLASARLPPPRFSSIDFLAFIRGKRKATFIAESFHICTLTKLYRQGYRCIFIHCFIQSRYLYHWFFLSRLMPNVPINSFRFRIQISGLIIQNCFQAAIFRKSKIFYVFLII